MGVNFCLKDRACNTNQLKQHIFVNLETNLKQKKREIRPKGNSQEICFIHSNTTQTNRVHAVSIRVFVVSWLASVRGARCVAEQGVKQKQKQEVAGGNIYLLLEYLFTLIV